MKPTRAVPIRVLAVALVLLLGSSTGGCTRKSGTGSGGGPTPLPSGAVPVPPSEAKSPPASESNLPPNLVMRDAPLSFAPIAKKADPSVVTINTVSEEIEPGGLFSRGKRRREAKGLGTGFIVDKDGTILTNNHVIEGADSITVQLSNEHQFPARIVGRDPRTDVAVVHIDTKDSLVPLVLGDSDKLDVGDWVVAIGNPFGLSHTVSAGIVSAKGRSRDDVPLDPTGYYDFLQTDASINPGNSGGPLFNLRGEVVGMNTAIRGGGAQGIGFAIPINMVKQLLPTLIREGKVIRSALGVRIRDLRELLPQERDELKVAEERGALVEQVEPGGGADKAGLASGDVIVAFEGTRVDRGTHLQWLASTAGVGRTVTVRVVRAGKAFDQKLTLGALPELKLPPKRPAPKRRAPQQDDDQESPF